MIHRALLFCLAATVPTTAFAHGGHLGELAGHSHWLGAAAVAGAALIAGLVALKDRKDRKADDTQDVQADDDDTSGEPAGDAAR